MIKEGKCCFQRDYFLDSHEHEHVWRWTGRDKALKLGMGVLGV